MTTRRFNYTGCLRIRRADVRIGLSGEEVRQFTWMADLEEYEFPASAEIVVEAYAHWTVGRFSCGTIANPDNRSIALEDFASGEGVLFRLKVVGVGEDAGLILGEADQIHPADADGKGEARSFLPVVPADLGDVVWQLSFASGNPSLLINDRISDWKSYLRRAEVRALILPEVYRQMLRAAAAADGGLEEGSWQATIISSVPAGVGTRPAPTDDEGVEAWVADAAARFARKHRFIATLPDLTSDVS